MCNSVASAGPAIQLPFGRSLTQTFDKPPAASPGPGAAKPPAQRPGLGEHLDISA